jgi:alpha-galactosidase/6-phospho-beta-glucosidase family protein
MMAMIKQIELRDGSALYVEMEQVDDMPKSRPASRGDLPSGAEEVTAAEHIVDAMQALQNTLHTVFNTVHEGVKNNAPDEWGVELNIGFKGKVNPIPVIVGSESSVAIKVHAKWVKSPK